MFIKLILLLSISFFLNLVAYAQSTCECDVGNGGCSASQSCPAGKIAECTCSATGCSSSCVDETPILDFAELDFEKALRVGDSKTLAQFFARTLGKNVEFIPASSDAKITYVRSKNGHASHWDALGFLAEKGELKINGHNLKFWTDIRDSFLNGGELTICTSRADIALRQISFITGKKFSVISGDSQASINTPIKGNGLQNILRNLSKAANIEIVSR